jgi:hypothetical protein
MKYRKKPVVIEAYQTDKELDIETLEGTMHASVGDYIITGVRGEKYPCKPDIFEQTYEPADVPTASPWHRVEEKPKEAAQYFVIWENNGDRGGGAAWFSLRLGWIWGGPKITHWMPIEPPKEENNG